MRREAHALHPAERVDALPLRIDLATNKQRDDVLGLLAEHMPGTNVAARFTWLYEQNPHGHALTVVAYDAGTNEPLGVTSVFPRRLLVRGRPVMGSMGGDAYVRPRARRQGVATAMHKALLEQMKNEGVEVMFGPPEPHNLRALEHVGARVITHVARYVRPPVLHDALRPASWMGAGLGTRLDPVAEDDPRIDAIFSRTADDSFVVPVRDAAFVTWRFTKSPSASQRAFVVMNQFDPVGICVLERKSGRTALVDLLAPQASYVQSLHAVISASSTRSLVLQLNEEGPFAKDLKWMGLVPRERKPFQVLVTNNDDPALFDPTRWYYTWGDGDLDCVL